MIVRGNQKLGPELIWSFSLPAIESCPGASSVCMLKCYATNGHYRRGSVRTKYEANLRRTRTAEFADELAEEIRSRYVRVMRIHGSGDFYSMEYIRDWIEVARRCPKTTFYFYTRSWREPHLRDALIGLSGLPNVYGWFSCDRETGLPDLPAKPEGVRYAWMVDEAIHEVDVPYEADLAFRDESRKPVKRLNGVLVCPYENGVPLQRGRITCDTCQICFSESRNRKV